MCFSLSLAFLSTTSPWLRSPVIRLLAVWALELDRLVCMTLGKLLPSPGPQHPLL